MRCAPVILALLALSAPVGCAAGRVDGSQARHGLGPFGGSSDDTAEPGDSGLPGDSGNSDDTAVPTDDTGAPGDSGDSGDSGGSGGSDTGSGDTSTPPDTGGDTGDEPAPCLGITSISPGEATVVSTDTYEEIVVTLTGCATNVWVGDNSIYSGSAGYVATWSERPADFDGTTTATLVYTGPAAYPAESEMYFTFTSDQGDFGPFILKITRS